MGSRPRTELQAGSKHQDIELNPRWQFSQRFEKATDIKKLKTK